MEASTLISVVSALAAFISTFAVTRYMVIDMKKNQELIFQRLDRHGDDIVALNTKSELAVTAKDVDDKFVSKELFRQFEKHIDKRFDTIQDGQNQILAYVKSIADKEEK